jgi:hypothetical protein
MNSDIFYLFKKFQMAQLELIKRGPSRSQTKYGFEYFEIRNNFLHPNFFRFERDFELKSLGY